MARLRSVPAHVRSIAPRLLGLVPEVVRVAITSFGRQRGAEAAAGMAYYAFFSLFPLLVFLVAAGGLLLGQERVYAQLRALLEGVFPLPSGLLRANLDEILRLHAPLGLVALASLLWSGIGFFSLLGHNISLAWPESRPRGFFGLRLIGLKMAGGLLLLLILAVILSIVAGLAPRIPAILSIDTDLFRTVLWRTFSVLAPWLASFMLFFGLYRWVPRRPVTARPALVGALFASVSWRVVTDAFTWYLGSGLSTYRMVYGSLSGVVAALFWIYLSNVIALFGAHLAAAAGIRRVPLTGAPDDAGDRHDSLRT